MFDHEGQWFLTSKTSSITGKKEYLICDETVVPETFKKGWTCVHFGRTFTDVYRTFTETLSSDVHVSTKDGDFALLDLKLKRRCYVCKQHRAHWYDVNHMIEVCSEECVRQYVSSSGDLNVPAHIIMKANHYLRDYLLRESTHGWKIMQEDIWHEVSDEWDLNITLNEKGEVRAHLYPINEGWTDTDRWQRIF